MATVGRQVACMGYTLHVVCPYGTEAAAPVTGEAELTALKDQAQYLEGMLTDCVKGSKSWKR
jgi:hypothetical protein